MACFLDTNVAIHLRDGDARVQERVRGLGEGVLLSVVTRVELEGGVYREPEYASIRRARLEVILRAVPTVPFDEAAAEMYGRIVSQAGYSRRKLLDRMIAAQALVHRARLVTLNAEDFRDVPGLEIEAW